MNLPSRITSGTGNESGVPTGGTRTCQMEGCRGLLVGVRWPDGKLTWPCTKGMDMSNAEAWKIQA
jgi:hypothetical protein